MGERVPAKAPSGRGRSGRSGRARAPDRRKRWIRRPAPPKGPASRPRGAPDKRPEGRVRDLDEPDAFGRSANQAPVIRRPKKSWLRNLWLWLLEDTGATDKPTKRTQEATAHASAAASSPRRSKRKARHPGAAATRDDVGREEIAANAAPAGKDDDPNEAPNEERDRADWRWMLGRCFKSNQRVFVVTRLAVVLGAVLLAGWLSMVSVTAFDPVDQFFTTPNPDDPKTWFRSPFFIVESGSMMHPDAPFGRLGTVDPGDVVVIRKVESREDVQTFYGPADRKTAGKMGDVIVFVPAPTRENPFPQPVVHRAVAYLERSIVQIPNPSPNPGSPAVVSVPRFTVAEFGVYDARSVTIPELGLFNYQPDRSGFLTRGDNPRTNDLADQALGVTPHPIEEDRILGRVVVTVPYVGLARIALMGQDPSQISADHQWCTFLAGQAPCDNWVVFLVLVVVFVGVPFTFAVVVFARRSAARWRERRRFEREQEAALARYEEQRRARLEDEARGPVDSSLRRHDALDLLAGRVMVAGHVRRAGAGDEAARLRPGLHFQRGAR